MMEQTLNEGIEISCDMIIQKEGKILMGKRGNVFGKGSWAFPGGHLEFGETVEECARRELKEEVNIVPTKIKVIKIINDIPNTEGQVKHTLRFIFLIEDFSGEIKNNEPDKCDGWEWFDSKKLPSPVFVGHIKPLEAFLAGGTELFIEK